MTVKQLFSNFSQPLQTVSIYESIHPEIPSDLIYQGEVRDIPTRLLGMVVSSWCGNTNWYGNLDNDDSDILVIVKDNHYNESRGSSRYTRNLRRRLY